MIRLEAKIRSAIADPDARISDVFDLIVGTGIGGILAAMITAADGPTGRPLFSARGRQFLRSRQRRSIPPPPGAQFCAAVGGRQVLRGWLEGVLREAFRGRSGRLLTLRGLLPPASDPVPRPQQLGPLLYSSRGGRGPVGEFRF
ncbi:hypothetical protein HPP92_013910 [Vanilla planifolia]|uniref:Patatin n=1 Tax=Vanilla planifolia TaxID=51239 RepID=A0A835UV76_VANPL|nr:hypothetical protein HPP92_013910 [Vanilla planifolia]